MGYTTGRRRVPGETYPEAPRSGAGSSVITETRSAFAAGPIAILPSGLNTIVGGGVSVTVPAGGKLIIMASANISGSAAQLVSLDLIVDGSSVMQNNVTSSGASAQESPGLIFELVGLSAGTHTVDVQADTEGGSNMSAANGSLVVMVAIG